MAAQRDEARAVQEQYRTAAGLEARRQIYRFSQDRTPWQRWVFDHLALSADCRLLELGCGTGRLWLENAGRLPPGWTILLTDFSAGMVEEARRTLAGMAHRFAFAVANAQAIPLAAASVDAVVANHMVYHVPDKPALFAEVRRVLRPGGRFYAATNGTGGGELEALLRRFDAALQTAVEREMAVAMAATHPRTFTLENGQEQLAPWFGRVTTHRFAGATVVPEVEPIVAYVLSMPSYRRYLEGERLAAFRRFVAAEIDRAGAFRMTRVVGIFEAERDGQSGAVGG